MKNERVAPQLREPRAAGVSPQGEGGASPPSKELFIIGVTGGMASGKSTIARMIAGERFPHLDADALVHQLMATDAATIQAIGEAFPTALVNGAISRAQLSAAIAQDARHIATLESILHPRVRAEEERAIAAARAEGKSAIILDIPLLFETGADALCDAVLTASAPEDVRKSRAFARPGMTDAKWQRLIARQWNDAQRNARADVVIDTTKTMKETQAQLDHLLDGWGLLRDGHCER
ncbi:MAG: dephospho-CoA kinase [Azospirillum brasilense]|nr:MAG: dephospho-CoA kinase [Azospirillum brasilense]